MFNENNVIQKNVWVYVKNIYWIVRCLHNKTTRSFGESLTFNSKGRLKCISLNNWPSQIRPTLVDINSNETLFDPFTVSIDKCGGSCNAIDDPYIRVCVNKVKYMNVKVFALMLGVNETKFLVQHASCECKCGWNESVSQSKNGIMMNVDVSLSN